MICWARSIASACGAQARADVRFLYLPLRPRVAGLFLLALERGEGRPRAAELLVETVSTAAPLDQRCLDFGAALFRAGEPVPQPIELGRQLGQFALEVGDATYAVLAGRNRLALSLAGRVSGLLRLRRGRVQGSEVGGSAAAPLLGGGQR